MTRLTTAYVYNIRSKKINTIIKGDQKKIEDYYNYNFDNEKNGSVYGNDYTNCGKDSLSYVGKTRTIYL